MDNFRLVMDGPQSAAGNMAADEAMLINFLDNKIPPTLRFYSWDVPTLSLGYFQKTAHIDFETLRKKGGAAVRRPTGGRAVLHWQEVTFSLVAKTKKQGLWEVFKSIHQGLEIGLNSLGIPAAVLPTGINEEGRDSHAKTPACFAAHTKYELTLNGKKIVGSAQKIIRDCVLVHGSLPIMPNFDFLYQVIKFHDEKSREAALKQALSKMTCLYWEMGKEYDPDEIAKAVAYGFEKTWNSSAVSGEFSKKEKELIKRLAVNKYETDQWLYAY